MATEGYKLLICDNCSDSQMRSKAYNSPEKNGMYVIADTTAGIAKAYNKNVQIEPGYEVTIEYTEIHQTTVPQEFTTGFQQYLEVKTLLANSNTLWTEVPKHLSVAGSYSAKAVKAPEPVDVSDLGNSIHLLFDVATSEILQRAISNRLRNKYLVGDSFWSGIAKSFTKLTTLKPLTVTVTFPDGSIDFTIHGGTMSGASFKMVADTALDSDNKPLNKVAPTGNGITLNSIGSGFYAGVGEFSWGNATMNCKTTFVRFGWGHWSKTLSCKLSY